MTPPPAMVALRSVSLPVIYNWPSEETKNWTHLSRPPLPEVVLFLTFTNPSLARRVKELRNNNFCSNFLKDSKTSTKLHLSYKTLNGYILFTSTTISQLSHRHLNSIYI